MEPTTIASVTLASILAALPNPDQPVSQSVITTHISPAIAGQWEIELPSVASSGAAVPLDESQAQDKLSTDSDVAAEDTGSARELATTAAPKDTKAQAGSSCRELYNFGEDNNVWAVSGVEWTYGKYLVTHPEQGLPIIAIKTLYDNNEVDCSGNQVDQTNEALVAYLEHDDTKMQWCADPEGKECFMTFHRILP